MSDTRPSLLGMKRGLLDEALAGYDDADLILPLQHLKATVEALDAVLALHTPDGIGCCYGCGNDEAGYANVPWPCQTVRAITEHVDIDSTRANEEASHG